MNEEFGASDATPQFAETTVSDADGASLAPAVAPPELPQLATPEAGEASPASPIDPTDMTHIRAYRSNENYYEDYIDALRTINIIKKHEVVDEVEDVHRLRRAWYYTLFIVFGLILLLCVLVLNQAITLPRRFPTLFCWEDKFLNATKKVKACRGADLSADEEWLRPNVTATQLGLLRAFPSLYSALNAMTIYKFVPESAGEFLQLCLAKFGAQCPYLVWRGTWPSNNSPLDALRNRLLPDPTFTKTDADNPCDPWEHLSQGAAPSKFAGTGVACLWRCWLAFGATPANLTDLCNPGPNPCKLSSRTECKSISRGWFRQTCMYNPFYDWFSSDQDAFFRTPAVVEYISLLGTPQLSAKSKLYNLYEKGLVAFAIQELESSTSMSGLDLFNYLFNPSVVIRTPPQDCSNVKSSTTANDASSAFGLGSMALPFFGPIVGPAAAIGGGIGAYVWGSKQGQAAEDACKQQASAWTKPTNPPNSSGEVCGSPERNNCMYTAGTQKFIIDPFPCTKGFKP